MSDKEHSEGISKIPPTNATASASTVPMEHDLQQEHWQNVHQDETHAVETPNQKAVIEARSDAAPTAETSTTLLNGYPTTQQPLEVPLDGVNEFATEFANHLSVSQKDLGLAEREPEQFHQEVLQHQSLSPCTPAQLGSSFATPPTFTHNQDEGIATQLATPEAATDSLPAINVISSTTAPEPGAGGSGIGTPLSGSTENIDPVASYSAWRKKKDTETLKGTQAVMESFLKQHSAYDVLPVSYRQIVLDTTLLVKKALSVLMQYSKWVDLLERTLVIWNSKCGRDLN